ncbi:bromodomain-containing protein DDB_G0280777 [Drosophila innubila]|uniref:bromodomain-containing protein DDB_G0280777 n=1 Tax=Drosophila innubila TaxID=198719 RepID=UPI00148BACBD|nr:bromodomain-containing protein DDB_G0280777 [Drosophila innubila]
MQLKAPKGRNMASLKDEELAANNRQNNNNNNNNNSNCSSSNNASTSTNNNNNNSNNNNNNNNINEDASSKRESLEARKQNLEQRLSEKSWLLQQIQKQETATIHGNYEHLTINEFFAQLAQQYKHEQQLQALSKDNNALLRRKQSTNSRGDSQSHNNINNNNNRHSETHSNRSSEYDNYQPVGAVGDMLVIGVAQQQSQQHPHVKSALKKRPTPTPTLQYVTQTQQRQQQQQQHQQMPQQQHIMLQQQLHHMEAYAYQQQQQQQRAQPDVISMYSANSSNVATLRQQHVAPQQQPIIVQCDKYYLSPTHQSYNEGGFIKSSQNIKKYVSPLASPSAISYEQSSLQHQQHQRQLDAISLAPSYMSVEVESVQQQQYRWRSQSHIAALTPPHPHQNPIQSMTAAMSAEAKSHSSDMLAAPLPRYNLKPKPLDEISLCSTSVEKKPKPKQWLESSLDGPAVVRQIESTAHSPVSSSGSSVAAAAGIAPKPRTKLSSQSMSVSGRHYSMSAQRSAHNYAPAGYAVPGSSKALQHADERFAKLSQSTSYLNAMEQTVGISASYPLEPLDIPPFRHLPPKPNHNQQPTPPPRPPPVGNSNNNNNNISNNSPNINNNNNMLQNALVSPPLAVATAPAAASLSPDIRIESPKNMTVVQQATFQPYKEVTKPFEMSDFYKYSTKFKQKEGGRPE